jgi:hypothetical protein
MRFRLKHTSLFLLVYALAIVSAAHAQSSTIAWPTTSDIHVGKPVLLVLHSNLNDEVLCRVADLTPDIIACASARHTAPEIYARSSIALIETSPHDFRGHARTFLRTGGLLLIVSISCALLSGNVACAAPAAAGIALVLGALACTFIDTHNAITGLNRRRILYADTISNPAIPTP